MVLVRHDAINSDKNTHTHTLLWELTGKRKCYLHWAQK